MEVLKNFDAVIKEYALTTENVASKLGITPQSLRASLRVNPTLSRLKDVADAIGCPITSLVDYDKDEVFGIIKLDGKTHILKSRTDLAHFIIYNMRRMEFWKNRVYYHEHPDDAVTDPEVLNKIF